MVGILLDFIDLVCKMNLLLNNLEYSDFFHFLTDKLHFVFVRVNHWTYYFFNISNRTETTHQMCFLCQHFKNKHAISEGTNFRV